MLAVTILNYLNREYDEPVIKRFYRALNLFTKGYGVVMISPAGNAARFDPIITGWPSVLSKRFPPLIVAGAVDLANGEKSDYSQSGKFLTVSAPGAVQ